MINHACPLIVLDDESDELWAVTQGLGNCGFPAISHLIDAGKLERTPSEKYAGIRFFFTDLHVLGGGAIKLEAHVSALAKFIQQLIDPTCYVLVFWSKFQDEVESAKQMLNKYLPREYLPFAYETLAKEDAKHAADKDQSVSEPAREDLRCQISEVVNRYPQLKAIMNWESLVSKAAVETTNRLISTISTITDEGACSFADPANVRAVLARMAQEALGGPHAPDAPTKGLTIALLPILQDLMERAKNGGVDELQEFLAITDDATISLPHASLSSLLNDFFVHAEGQNISALERGAVIRLAEAYLNGHDGLSRDISVQPGDWKDSVGREFVLNWGQKSPSDLDDIRAWLDTKDVYAVELSADCDHAQNKSRSQRFLFAFFVSSARLTNFFSKKKTAWANGAIYATPEITLGGVRGKLLISCRIFFARPHGNAVLGRAVTRLRKDVIDEVSHHYVTHMRRPGAIAFS
jgi:hypothetical protein